MAQAELDKLLWQFVARPGEDARSQELCAGSERERGAYLLLRGVLVTLCAMRRARSTDFAACPRFRSASGHGFDVAMRMAARR